MALSFAILRPANVKATTAFPSVLEYATRDSHHSRFVGLENTGLPSPLPPSSQSSQTSVDWSNTVIELSLEDERLPEFPRIGWRIGRGSTGKNHLSDLCIALPDSTNVAATHGRFFLHPRSGLLVLEAGADPLHPIYYMTEARRMVEMKPKQALPLIQASTSVIIAGAEYQISYTVSEETEAPYFTKLDEFLLRCYGSSIHPAGKYIPSMGRSECRYFKNYMTHASLGDGTFGHVSYGIDLRTGEPVAIKETRVRSSHERQSICAEIRLQRHVQDSSLFLRYLDSWCSKHHSDPQKCPGRDFEHIYIVTEVGLYDFRHPSFTSLPSDQVIEAFRQTLLAINELHRRGLMHRDITRANMMVMSTSPFRAVLVDFGKAVAAKRCRQTSIGPKATLAPEVRLKDYDSEIDLWSWAYAAAQWLGYRELSHERDAPIDKSRLASIHEFLDGAKQKEVDERMKKFTDLLQKILVWDRAGRLTVSQAASHEVWSSLHVDAEDMSRPAKKIKLITGSASTSSTTSTVRLTEISEEV